MFGSPVFVPRFLRFGFGAQLSIALWIAVALPFGWWGGHDTIFIRSVEATTIVILVKENPVEPAQAESPSPPWSRRIGGVRRR